MPKTTLVRGRSTVVRRGRPSVNPGESSVSLSVTVPVSTYDRLTQMAARQHSDLAPLVREALSRFSTENSTVPRR